MSLIRWDPFSSLDSMFGRMPALPRWAGLPDFNGDSRFEWSPSADISETDQEYLIRAAWKGGIVTIHLPKMKSETKKAKEIKIQ